jgi:membrane protease YdiL (CAAX protease family)
MPDLLNKKERFIDLIFVLSATCFIPIFFSVYSFLSGQQIYDYSKLNYELSYLGSAISKLLGVLILIYVLYKQGRTIHDIGYSFKSKDLIHAVLLAVSAYFIYLMIYQIIYPIIQSIDLTPKNIDLFKGKMTIFYFLMTVINPWYEELILRAYVISEVKWFTQNAPLAIAISVFIQGIGHLYQGVFAAISVSILFLTFSIYYVKTSRITPVILAHLFYDIISMVVYAAR